MLRNEISTVWTERFQKYLHVNTRDREYETRKDRKIPEEEWSITNQIMEQHLTEIGKEQEISIWQIDVTAITLSERHGKLRETSAEERKPSKPDWQANFENRVSAIRRKLSQVDVVIKCLQENRFTNHQMEIKRKLTKRYGNLIMNKLLKIQTDLKINLKIQTEKMRNRKRINERNRINQLFAKYAKQVYREFKSNDIFKIENPPTAEQLENFWGGIWQKDSTFNEEAAWLKDPRKNYCKDFVENQHKTDENVVKKIISSFLKTKLQA